MATRRWWLGLIAIPLLLTGCTAEPAGTQPGSSMSMAPGQSMPGMPVEQSSDAATKGPSATALMICKGDVPADIAKALALPTPPKVNATFVDGLYTCTYDLPMGPMVLSVKDLPSKPAAGAYFDDLRPTLGATEDSPGLGERAYATTLGRVVVLKDHMTLSVDATGLPAIFGAQKQKRTDFAYEVASIVLGCWIEHT